MIGRVIARWTILAAGLAACSPSSDTASDNPRDSTPAVAVDSFIPGFDPSDPASAAFAAYLDHVREGGPALPDSMRVMFGCGADTALVHPTTMLAAFEVSGRTVRGDTSVMRARTVTVAEENAMGTVPPRYTATQRLSESEWEWDVMRDGDTWRVCNGPRFGFFGSDAATSWRPTGASRAMARALAESIWASRSGRGGRGGG